ncbi:MAG: hypothetical protein CL878_00280 [Dehalococcoidia bacterium]|nr:hypothetical protein [Dehalococcoidia bacterium]
MPSYLAVVLDADAEVLEHWDLSDRALITAVPGGRAWADYAIEAEVRQILAHTEGNADDEFGRVGRTGVVFRYQDLRRYYFFGLEGYDRLVLARRDDEIWAVLADAYEPFDRARYYALRAEVRGDQIRGLVDGEQRFVVRDAAYASGKAGLRTNTLSRVRRATVVTSEPARASAAHTHATLRQKDASLSEQYPRPVVWRRLDLTPYGSGFVRLGDLRGTGVQDVVVFHGAPNTFGVGIGAGEDTPRITALDLAGDPIWQQKYPGVQGAAASWLTKLHDMDGDGCDEIAASTGDQLLVLDGATGEVRASAPLPSAGPFFGFRGSVVKPTYHLYVVNVRGRPHAADLLIRDGDGHGGNTVWLYAYTAGEDRLELLWTHTVMHPKFGHHINAWDVDGDGREEILLGHWLLDDDGRELWLLEGGEYQDRVHGSLHADSVAIGNFDGDPSTIEIAVAGGSQGFYLVDAATGHIRRHHAVGHAQGLSVGNFRPDMPGLEILVGNRWGNYGILNLFSGAGERLHRFEPDNVTQGGPPVNWRGDGQELILLTSTADVFGLWDAAGRRVVRFPEVSERSFYMRGQVLVQPVTGDPRDEIVFVSEESVVIYTQDQPPSPDERIYAPTRRARMEIPWTSYPGWKRNVE